MIKQPSIFSPRCLMRNLLPLIFLITSAAACAENRVAIQNAWVKPTIPGQSVGAAYMTFNSKQDVTLLRVSSDVTESVEIHSMTMQDGVMKMRMLENLTIKAGKPYELKPGGFHLMLFNLKKPLSAGQHVNIELTFKSGNAEFKQSVKAPVQAPVEAEDHDHSHHHH